jgi:hypothetical protein
LRSLLILGTASLVALACGDSESSGNDDEAAAGTGGTKGQSGGDGSDNRAGSSSGNGDQAGSVSIPPSAGEWQSDFRDARVDVTPAGENTCSATAELLEASDVARVRIGESTLYAGFDQVSGDNQDPVVARVDGDTVVWCHHHENDGPDGRALGVTWDGGSKAYVVYTIVGGGSDLEKDGWFRSYGGHAAISGGGSKVSVLGQLDAASGELLTATHLIAIKSERKVNGHKPSGAPRVTADGSVEFYGESAHKPIGADAKNSMVCSDYPFNSKYRFSPDLKSLLCAECTNCTDNVLPCD